MNMRRGYAMGVIFILAGIIVKAEERHSLTFTNEARLTLVKEIGRMYDKAVSVEMPRPDFRSWAWPRLSVSLTNATIDEAMEGMIEGLTNYSWSIDERYGAVNIYKTDSTLLAWNVSLLAVTNKTVTQVMTEELRRYPEWRANKLRLEPGVSSKIPAWTDELRVTFSVTNVSARNVLNALCFEMSKGSQKARYAWRLNDYQGEGGISFVPMLRRER